MGVTAEPRGPKASTAWLRQIKTKDGRKGMLVIYYTQGCRVSCLSGGGWPPQGARVQEGNKLAPTVACTAKCWCVMYSEGLTWTA